MLLDFSRHPDKQRLNAMRRRMDRLALLERSYTDAVTAFDQLPGTVRPNDLRLRPAFVCRAEPAASDSSDRRVPPRSQRPPATRIASSRGAALRLELVALAAAQRYRSGTTFSNRLPIRRDAGHAIGWTSLVASPAQPGGGEKIRTSVLDKKVRALHTALTTLLAAKLVDLPNRPQSPGSMEGFTLLDDRGGALQGDPLPYSVPTARESTVDLPFHLITHGWVHVLEDSELSVLLMVACGLYSLPSTDGYVAIPADDRLLRYGVSRDAFEAHMLLSKLELLDVQQVERHDDGRAQDHGKHGSFLHRLRINADGFARQALPRLKQQLAYEMGRVE